MYLNISAIITFNTDLDQFLFETETKNYSIIGDQVGKVFYTKIVFIVLQFNMFITKLQYLFCLFSEYVSEFRRDRQ